MSPDIQIEGLLFYKSTTLKKQAIMTTLGLSQEVFDEALTRLRDRLTVGATRLVETDTEIGLMTAPELAPLIETVRKEELRGDIGKAGIETLAIVLYREPVTRAEIDRIRGVNSSFSLRALLMRGLIERKQGSGGAHVFYATPALLAHLGVAHKHDLPNFPTIMTALEQFEAAPEPTTS
jgi:segregation and condensation protein B